LVLVGQYISILLVQPLLLSSWVTTMLLPKTFFARSN